MLDMRKDMRISIRWLEPTFGIWISSLWFHARVSTLLENEKKEDRKDYSTSSVLQLEYFTW